MQPTNDDPQRSEPATGWLPSDTGNWAAPSYASTAPGATITKARPWLTAIVSFVVLLILIAALGNQWVTDSIARHANAGTFGDHMAHSVNVYEWRFAPPEGGDVSHLWLASLVNVGVVLLLTFLLVPVVCRGKGGFWQAFFSVWFTVVVATLLAGYASASVVDDITRFPGYRGQGRVDEILFASLAPGPATTFAGLAFGVVVGLAAGIAAVMTRRTEVIASQPIPTFGAPWTRDDETDQSWQAAPAPLPGPTASPSPWSGDDTDRTPDAGASERPAADGSGEQTAALPAVDQPTADEESQTTTQFPRNTPPAEDDETGPRHLDG